MTSTDLTLSYYNTNASEFVAGTFNVPFEELQTTFLSYLPPHASILDFGCGSGRDAKAFLAKGCRVTAVDGSPAICELASKNIGQTVICTTFQDYQPQSSFDGIWACASLLHLEWHDIITVMQTLSDALVAGGCFYASFKLGTASETRHGRFFTDMTEARFAEILNHLPDLRLDRHFLTGDARQNRQSEQWLNVFLIKDARP